MTDEFLSNIDWDNHDGVMLSMINDFMRNQFYDRVLGRYVKNQRCVDIGFGTGLLSMIALKHGAKHIRAFEVDANRYALGCEIIDRLDLKNRIELINERFDRTYDYRDVVFTETVNGNLWWEGLWNTLPDKSDQIFLPGNYFLEIWAVEIPESFAKGLVHTRHEQRSFNPGVDIDSEFVRLINEFLDVSLPQEARLSQGIVQFERQLDTDWGWIPYMRAVQTGSVVASYVVNCWQDVVDSIDLEIDVSDWHNSVVVLVPRMGMSQDDDKLYLDTGHWGPGENPVLLFYPTHDVKIKHNVRNGRIEYLLK